MSNEAKMGVRSILIASIFGALMGVAFFAAHRLEPAFSSFSGSFIRVLANLAFILLPISGAGRPKLLTPVRHHSLWLWGFFGALTVTSYFAAVALLGSGTSAFLSASSGVFIAALSPLIARQRVSRLNWLAIAGAVSGMFLMSSGAVHGQSSLGVGLALASGLCGALAYLMVARTKSVYATSTLMMTWCLSAIAAHLLIFCFFPVDWPKSLAAWALLGAAGVAASLNQNFTARAFQLAPASLVASLSYLAPVISLLLDSIVFGIRPTATEGLGAALILGFGAMLPMLART